MDLKHILKRSFYGIFVLLVSVAATACATTTNPDATIPGVTYTTTEKIDHPPVTVETTTIPEETQLTQPVTLDTQEVTQPPQTTPTPITTTTIVTITTTPKVTTTQKPQTTTIPPVTTPIPVETTTTPPNTSTSYPLNNYKALNHSEVRGVWISYLEYSTYLKGKSKSDFQAAVGKMLDNVSGMGLNTVYLHVRSHGDAYYPSSLFPWSSYVTGTFGKNPGYDPLSIFIEEAHARNLSLHAWINPLRGYTTTELNNMSDTYPVKKWYNDPNKKGTYLVEVSGRWYLNPAYSEVLQLLNDGAAEIISNYKVDGLHIDDYFYPTTDAAFDNSAFKNSGYSNISSFRSANIDQLVKGLYDAVNRTSKTALFGVSPAGSISYNTNTQYADVKKWCGTSGYLDYIMPQLYFGFKNSAEPFNECLAKWEAMIVPSDIRLIPGLSVYKIGEVDQWAGTGKNEWVTDTGILKRQYESAKKTNSYGGIVLYRYENIFGSLGDRTKVTNEINQLVSLF